MFIKGFEVKRIFSSVNAATKKMQQIGNWQLEAGLPDLLFVKGPNLVQKEPNSKTWGQKWLNHFVQIYQQLQSHVNPY